LITRSGGQQTRLEPRGPVSCRQRSPFAGQQNGFDVAVARQDVVAQQMYERSWRGPQMPQVWPSLQQRSPQHRSPFAQHAPFSPHGVQQRPRRHFWLGRQHWPPQQRPDGQHTPGAVAPRGTQQVVPARQQRVTRSFVPGWTYVHGRCPVSQQVLVAAFAQNCVAFLQHVVPHCVSPRSQRRGSSQRPSTHANGGWQQPPAQHVASGGQQSPTPAASTQQRSVGGQAPPVVPQQTKPGLLHQTLPVEGPPEVSQQQTPFGVPTQTSEPSGL
jgi:hypothetical protein